MKTTELTQVLDNMGLNVATFSFYSRMDEDAPDTEFGYCDISGELGELAYCTCLDTEKNEVELQVSIFLIHGALGRLAGAF